jgi:hypothetical protein
MPIASEKNLSYLCFGQEEETQTRSQSLAASQNVVATTGASTYLCTILRLQHQIHALQELPDVSEEHLEVVGMHGLLEVLEEICVLNVLPRQANTARQRV